MDLASLALLLLQESPVVRAPQEHASEPDGSAVRRELEAERDAYLHPDLERALEEVFRFERRLLELGILDERGVPADPTGFERDPEIASFLMDGEEELFVGRHGFAFGERTPSYEPVLECGKHDRGLVAAQRLWREGTELEPEDLLRPLDAAFLEASPVRATLQAQELHEFALREGALAPLSNGSITYVIWGFLHLDEFWRGRLDEREQFLADLIDRGSTTPITGRAVLRILQAPLLYDPEQRGQGVAYDLFELRDRVGFTRKHKDQLEQLLDLVAELDAADRQRESSARTIESGAPIATPDAERTPDAGAVPRVPEETLDHLREWAPRVLHWVLLELEPDPLNQSLRRSSTIEGRLQYWEQLARTVPYSEFRDAMLAEVDSMLRGLDEPPGHERLQELLALEDSESLTPELEKELRLIRGEIKDGRCTLVSRIAELSFFSGEAFDYELMVSTLAFELHPRLTSDVFTQVPGTNDVTPEYLLQRAWIRVGMSPSPARVGILQSVVDGTQPYPKTAVNFLIVNVSMAEPDEWASLCEGFLAHGSPYQRATALSVSDWLPEERFAHELDRLFSDSTNPSLASSDRQDAFLGAMASLHSRDEASARLHLIQSIQAGHWRDLPQQAEWTILPTPQWTRALGTLTPAELADFRARGLLPAHVR